MNEQLLHTNINQNVKTIDKRQLVKQATIDWYFVCVCVILITSMLFQSYLQTYQLGLHSSQMNTCRKNNNYTNHHCELLCKCVRARYVSVDSEISIETLILYYYIGWCSCVCTQKPMHNIFIYTFVSLLDITGTEQNFIYTW